MADDLESTARRVYREAVIALPEMTRAIFLQHRINGEAIDAIAAYHALPADVVTQHIADALIAIDRALRAAGF